MAKQAHSEVKLDKGAWLVAKWAVWSLPKTAAIVGSSQWMPGNKGFE